MKTITLKNDFHNSEVKIRVRDFREEKTPAGANPTAAQKMNNMEPIILSCGQLRRIQKELCGIKTCTCGGVRGIQDLLTIRGESFKFSEIEGTYDNNGRESYAVLRYRLNI